MGVAYCRTWAECAKCYSPLREPEIDTPTKKRKKKNDNGVVSSVSTVDLDKPTYWHKPLPTNPGEEMYQEAATQPPKPFYGTSASSGVKRPGRWRTSLRCPNNCRVDQHGAIKWECSGTLDDGTGQARLFSERESSLCLLGLSPSTIETIEEGAWLNEDGVVFSKTVPSKGYLRSAIITARTLAMNHRRNFHNKRSLEDNDVLLFLTPIARADYLLQRHCRSSLPVRDLDYFVRCKPLSDGVVHVKQTEIEVFPGNEVPTYALPPLKLQLVDCCLAQRNTN